MRFSQDSISGTNLIRAYGDGQLRINDTLYRGAVIVSVSSVVHEPETHQLAQLLAIDRMRIMALNPELILLGTGSRQIFPAVSFGAQFLRDGIGFEVMDTGAACRTFNVLAAEQRRVVAMLLV
ncbi:MAG: MTH938/NDUFAF3 family protein [Pseudomonadota bacterium]|nr:MTH938/NDUFAF3 family protein [Pseudomonadota bacterium]